MLDEFDIPPFLKQERPAYLDLPVSQWPKIETRRNVTDWSSPKKDQEPKKGAWALKGSSRDIVPFDITKAVKAGHDTFGKLRKHFVGKLTDKEITAGLALAKSKCLIKLIGRTYSDYYKDILTIKK